MKEFLQNQSQTIGRVMASNGIIFPAFSFKVLLFASKKRIPPIISARPTYLVKNARSSNADKKTKFLPNYFSSTEYFSRKIRERTEKRINGISLKVSIAKRKNELEKPVRRTTNNAFFS